MYQRRLRQLLLDFGFRLTGYHSKNKALWSDIEVSTTNLRYLIEEIDLYNEDQKDQNLKTICTVNVVVSNLILTIFGIFTNPPEFKNSLLHIKLALTDFRVR